MRYLILLIGTSLFAGIGPYSDISVSTQGVGFRATIAVTQYCVMGDPRMPCTTGTKAVLFKDQTGIQPLSNSFQSQPNGFFQFFTQNGWYDILVSGLGITTYSYRVFVSDGTFVIGGAAGGDLCGTYPAPIVCGLRGRALPGSAPTTNNSVPTFQTGSNTFIWQVPLFGFPAGQIDVTGIYPNLTVRGLWTRPIINAAPPNDGDFLRYSTAQSGWIYQAFTSTATAAGTMTFNLCLGVECQTGTNVTNPFIVSSTTITVSKCFISARVPPTTQNLIVDIVKNGVSIFPSGNANKMNLTPSGGVESKVVTSTGAEGDRYTANILQTGTGFGGEDVTVSCKASLQ